MGLRFPGAAELVAMLGPPGGANAIADAATVAANLVPKPGEDWWQLRVDLMKGRRVNNLQLRGNQITNSVTGRSLRTLRGPSKFGRILTTIGKTAIAFGFGYGMGQLGAMLARKAAWATVTGSFTQGAALGFASWSAPTAMSAVWSTAPGARWLAVPLGLGAWAGAVVGHAQWALDMLPDMTIEGGKRAFRSGIKQFHKTGRLPWYHQVGKEVARGAFNNPFAQGAARRSLTPGVAVW